MSGEGYDHPLDVLEKKCTTAQKEIESTKEALKTGPKEKFFENWQKLRKQEAERKKASKKFHAIMHGKLPGTAFCDRCERWKSDVKKRSHFMPTCRRCELQIERDARALDRELRGLDD